MSTLQITFIRQVRTQTFSSTLLEIIPVTSRSEASVLTALIIAPLTMRASWNLQTYMSTVQLGQRYIFFQSFCWTVVRYILCANSEGSVQTHRSTGSLNPSLFAVVISTPFTWASLSYEPLHHKTNKVTSATSKDLDQPGHPPSLIILHCLHEETLELILTEAKSKIFLFPLTRPTLKKWPYPKFFFMIWKLKPNQLFIMSMQIWLKSANQFMRYGAHKHFLA